MKKVSRSPKTIDARLFVQMWMESYGAGHTIREFADRVGMKYAQAYARYRFYRKKGVDLPELTRCRRNPAGHALPIGELNMLVDRMLVVPSDGLVSPARVDGPDAFGVRRKVPVSIG